MCKRLWYALLCIEQCDCYGLACLDFNHESAVGGYMSLHPFVQFSYDSSIFSCPKLLGKGLCDSSENLKYYSNICPRDCHRFLCYVYIKSAAPLQLSNMSKLLTDITCFLATAFFVTFKFFHCLNPVSHLVFMACPCNTWITCLSRHFVTHKGRSSGGNDEESFEKPFSSSSLNILHLIMHNVCCIAGDQRRCGHQRNQGICP